MRVECAVATGGHVLAVMVSLTVTSSWISAVYAEATAAHVLAVITSPIVTKYTMVCAHITSPFPFFFLFFYSFLLSFHIFSVFGFFMFANFVLQ